MPQVPALDINSADRIKRARLKALDDLADQDPILAEAILNLEPEEETDLKKFRTNGNHTFGVRG